MIDADSFTGYRQGHPVIRFMHDFPSDLITRASICETYFQFWYRLKTFPFVVDNDWLCLKNIQQ